MRFLSVIKSAPGQGAPPQSLQDAMGEFIAACLADGSVVETGGLASIQSAVRVRQEGGMIQVIDGPYTEIKEIIGGYAMMEYVSREDAVAGTVRFMELHLEHWPGWVGECELREVEFLAP